PHQTIKQAINGDLSLLKQLAQVTNENAVSIITGIEFNQGRREISVNVPNENLAIANLPKEAIVEIPAMVDGKGIHPEKVGLLPEAIAAICRHQIAIQELLVEAYAAKSRDLLLAALLLEPTVDSVKRAKQMIDEFLRLQSGYLPEMS
ncbi:MAG: alpha-glucosidase/alpha-galactosidase, partial [Candidatus Omnitrophica bacterium]|nr:alpha-glucosidase/alpha-galactosidase [Candidatus Omnitrophota bacterium]